MTNDQMRKLGFFEVAPRIIYSARLYLRCQDRVWLRAFEKTNLDCLIKLRDIRRREREDGER